MEEITTEILLEVMKRLVLELQRDDIRINVELDGNCFDLYVYAKDREAPVLNVMFGMYYEHVDIDKEFWGFDKDYVLQLLYNIFFNYAGSLINGYDSLN